MATDKKFNVFGVSKHNGEYKVRFANDIMRIKVLAKHGHEDIRLAELDESVDKYTGIQKIRDMDEFQDAAAQSAIGEYLEDKAPKAGPAVKASAKAKSTKPTKKTREADAVAQAKAVAALEDAPF